MAISQDKKKYHTIDNPYTVKINDTQHSNELHTSANPWDQYGRPVYWNGMHLVPYEQRGLPQRQQPQGHLQRDPFIELLQNNRELLQSNREILNVLREHTHTLHGLRGEIHRIHSNYNGGTLLAQENRELAQRNRELAQENEEDEELDVGTLNDTQKWPELRNAVHEAYAKYQKDDHQSGNYNYI